VLHGRTRTYSSLTTAAVTAFAAAAAVAGWAVAAAPTAAAPAETTAAGVTPVTSTTIDLGSPAGAAGAAGAAVGAGEVAVPAGTDMVAFTWSGDPDGALEVRSGNADGTWSPWVDLHGDGEEAPDPGTEGRVADAGEADAGGDGGSISPVWVGGTDRVEVVAETALTDLRLHALEIGAAPTGSAEAAVAWYPAIHFRGEWGAAPWATGNADCGSGPRYARPHYLIVHHTVNVNTYSAAEVPAMLRGIQSFHQNTRGWCDIAYNFVIDHFGRIWEARAGGADRGVIGGHAAGHNTGSVGIALLGDHTSAGVTGAAVAATAEVVGWKAAVHYIDPRGTTTVDGGPSPTVIGHRDVGQTSCPGDLAYSRLAEIRNGAVPWRTNYAPYYTEYARRYVDAAYLTFLGRPADPSGQQYWSNFVTSGQPRSVFTGTLARSDEWINRSLDVMYRNVFGRPGDTAGMRYWADRVRAGLRLTDVGALLYGSPEYFQRSGGTNESFVRALYRALLLRDADQGGVDYWTGLLRAGRSRTEIASGFYGSIESRSGRVTQLYVSVLGRGPDAAGLGFWADRLLRVDDVDLAADLAASEEYFWNATE
jgi:N-acetylmuramoyl-L-alanine amidase/Domain of unknown function (DUF4214)